MTGYVHHVVDAAGNQVVTVFISSSAITSEVITLISADEGVRGGRKIPLKENVDEALRNCPNVHSVVTVKRTGNEIPWNADRDVWYDELTAHQATTAEPEVMDSEDPLFILYTSGSTGKPKGVQHSSAGYLLHAAMTHKYVFDYQDGDIYWCTADVGWITGHSYIVYGPLANGATTLMFEGVPTYPDASRCWQQSGHRPQLRLPASDQNFRCQ